MGLKIEKLIECKGAGRYGTCIGCGRDSVEDIIGMIRITGDGCEFGQGTSFCLCRECRYRFISALLKLDTNVPTNSALDNIHNVVAEREYQRGYEQAKEEYGHKLTEIKSRFKDRYYNKGYSEGYEQGKADAEKEMHDNILRYRMPAPWEGE